MIVTLIAIICNSGVCADKIVMDSDASPEFNMVTCAIHGQMIVADWMKQYPNWTLNQYTCYPGKWERKAI